uniref:Uncharacterized protein n=1 Tax=Picea sitchensis TaxID=3332 RepID=A0A6B9XX75_PICSI|nr:hypothetical protein Q903MT_gene6697 [Picea sitchensis]
MKGHVRSCAVMCIRSQKDQKYRDEVVFSPSLYMSLCFPKGIIPPEGLIDMLSVAFLKVRPNRVG